MKTRGNPENNRNPIVLQASIVNQLGEMGIDPIAELVGTLGVEFRFIPELDWERPEVRLMVNNRNFETVPVDTEKLCADCRKVTPGAASTECKHCKSTKVHRYILVQRCGRIKADAMVRLIEFLHPKLRASEVTGKIDHKFVVQLISNPGSKAISETVITLDPERNLIGHDAQTPHLK